MMEGKYSVRQWYNKPFASQKPSQSSGPSTSTGSWIGLTTDSYSSTYTLDAILANTSLGGKLDKESSPVKNEASSGGSRSASIRPQDAYSALAKNQRKLNKGEVDYTANPNAELMLNCHLQNHDFIPRFNQVEISKPHPIWITEPKYFLKLIGILKKEKEFAIQVEYHASETRIGFISLIEISTWEHGDFLVDPFKLLNEIKKDLKNVLESDQVTKVMFDCGRAVHQIRKGFGIDMVKVVDASELYTVYSNGQKSSLIELGARLFPPHLHRLIKYDHLSGADFRLRGSSFTEAQGIYATCRTMFSLRIYDQFRRKCFRKGKRIGNEIMENAFELTKQKCLVKFVEKSHYYNFIETTKDEQLKDCTSRAFKQLKSSPHHGPLVEQLNEDDTTLLMILIEWRFNLGNFIDLHDDEVIKDSDLLAIVQNKPGDVKALKNILGGSLNYTISKQAKIILKLVAEGEDGMDHLRFVQCFNCLRFGHVSCFCDKEETKNIFYTLPENAELKRGLGRRKRQNQARRRREHLNAMNMNMKTLG